MTNVVATTTGPVSREWQLETLNMVVESLQASIESGKAAEDAHGLYDIIMGLWKEVVLLQAVCRSM